MTNSWNDPASGFCCVHTVEMLESSKYWQESGGSDGLDWLEVVIKPGGG